METTVKKREWVKDAAIIFLAVLLVLTFFSNTIMNRSLPEVATAPVTNGNIVAKVRGSGTVAANGKHQVKAKETRTIRSVMVKAGQEVNAGDVLFVLGEGDETELEQAKEKLRSLQTSYQRTALSTPVADYSSYYRSIQNAEIAYERALDRLEEAQVKADEQSYPATTKAALQRYQDAKAKAEQLEQEYAVKKQERLQELKDREEVLTLQKEQMEQDAAAYQPQLDAAQQAYEAAVNDVSFWESEKQRAQEYYNVVSDPVSGYSEAEIQAAAKALTDAINALAAYQEALNEAENNFDAANAEMEQYLGPAYMQIVEEIAECQAEYQAVENDEEHYDEVRAAIEKRDRFYEEYLAQIGSAAENLRNAEYDLEEAEIALDAAYDSLNAAQANNNRSAASTGVELQSIAEEIKLQQEKIKSLAGEESNVVTADVSGTVDTVDCTAGDTVLKSALLCTIEVPDMGHTLSFAVTNAQAQRLRIGDTATVSNYYWGNSVTATLTSIRTDPKNPQTGKLLTFDLTGDVTTGAEMTISVGQKSATYDLIVPNSAIKSDTNGSYVLAVSSKSSPLGNRYSAKRISVEVLASDDNNSAVLADLTNGDYVITTSSAPIKSGDLVRMADS